MRKKIDMKVLHIVGGGLNGGAAMGAKFLHDALLRQGIQSSMLIQNGDNEKNNIYNIGKYLDDVSKKVHKKHFSTESMIKSANIKDKTSIFSLGICGNDITNIDLFKEADIIHLHWINNGMLSLRGIQKINKPIVWTLRDMWPLTGGCHYSLLCEEYHDECHNCHIMDNKISSWVYKMKKRSYHDSIVTVAISDWIKSCAIKSGLFNPSNIFKIPNFIDFDNFTKKDKLGTQEILNLPTDKVIICAGVQNFSSSYKGFDNFLRIIDSLDKNKFFLLLFGICDDDKLNQLTIDYEYVGFVSSRKLLAIVYNASDVFIITSVQEAFGKTVLESLSCGVPVVSYDSSGQADMIRHKINGYLAKSFDTNDFIKGIEWCIQNKESISLENLVDKSVFEEDKIVKKYLKAYKKALTLHSRGNKKCTSRFTRTPSK